MFRKSVFYLDLPLDHREGANDNAFGTASAFSKTSAISERFDQCRINPLCTTERCSPSELRPEHVSFNCYSLQYVFR